MHGCGCMLALNCSSTLVSDCTVLSRLDTFYLPSRQAYLPPYIGMQEPRWALRPHKPTFTYVQDAVAGIQLRRGEGAVLVSNPSTATSTPATSPNQCQEKRAAAYICTFTKSCSTVLPRQRPRAADALAAAAAAGIAWRATTSIIVLGRAASNCLHCCLQWVETCAAVCSALCASRPSTCVPITELESCSSRNYAAEASAGEASN